MLFGYEASNRAGVYRSLLTVEGQQGTSPAGMPRPQDRHASPRTRRGGGLKWLALAAGAAFLIYVALQVYARYGASDITQAETMVYGMLLFLAGTVLLALIAVMLFKLIGRLARRGSVRLFDPPEE